jgi:hypothetical protein
MPTNELRAPPTCLGKFYEQNPNFRTVSQQAARAKPWQGYPANSVKHLARAARHHQLGHARQEAPDAGLARMVKESNALMKA